MKIPSLKNIIQRAISGLIYLVVIIGSLFLGKIAFGLVFLLVCLVALYEFYVLTFAAGSTPYLLPSLIAGAIVFILSFLTSSALAGMSSLTLLLPLILFMFLIALYSGQQDAIRSSAISLLGILYIAIPLSTMNYLAFPQSNGYAYTHRIVLGILTLVWINDTGAYLVGITIGRHRLLERVSPKKSWEGAIGGALLTILCGWWLNPVMGILDRKDWLVFAVIVSVFGVLGDLTESLFKRNAGMKDSGSIIPGHGGILDRIDSLLFVMPLSLVYLVMSNL
jgi:phosphatidate cytidylyltransferase